MEIAGYKTHPAANVFPLLEGDEFAALVADVRKNGLVHPIVVMGDRVLDGRNRLRACVEVGLTPRFTHYEGDDPVGYVVSLNLTRRHMNESQRAMVAARIANLGDGQKKVGKFADVPSQPQAASMLSVGERTVRHAREVLTKATPEVVQAVDRGELAVSAAADLAKLEPEKQRAVLERSNGKPGNVRALVKQVEKAKVADQLRAAPPPTPKGPFSTIVADPPWHYDNRVEDASHRGALPYPSMTIDQICELPIIDVAEPDAVLWLWTTNAHMEFAYHVASAWGFTPKTILTWVKDRVGLGDWLRGQTEHCLLCVRGKPNWWINTSASTVLRGPLREHSRKPDEFYSLVESLCPGSKVELFCRQPREGWQAWGAEVDKFVGVK